MSTVADDSDVDDDRDSDVITLAAPRIVTPSESNLRRQFETGTVIHSRSRWVVLQ